jgi:hypothetical protein
MEQDRVVMAADSKVSAVGVGKTAAPDRNLSCKIIPMDDFAFASAGVLANPETGVSVASVMRTATANGGALKEKVKRFEEKISKTYSKLLTQFQRIDPTSYRTNFEGKAAIMAVFAQMNDQGPIYFLRTFRPFTKGNGGVEFKVEADDCLSKCSGAIFLGEFGSIQKYVEENKESLLKKDLAERARLLVETQIKATPQKVGPPIDILQVARDGNLWVQRKPECKY